MQCSKCKNEGIIFQPYSGQHLCRDHFIADFEAKAKRAIRLHMGMQPGDHIAVARNGDFAGDALLFFLRRLTAKRKDIRVSEIMVTGKMPDIMDKVHDSGVTKIFFSTPLEEASASVLADILRGEVERCFPTDNTIPVINPFAHIPAEEITTYARINGIMGTAIKPMPENDQVYIDVKTLLSEYSRRHPAAPHAVLNLGESLARADGEDNKVFPHGI
jgi:hypothetical protein